MEKEIIIVYGGSFNPPLNSHIYFSTKMVEQFKNLSKVLFVPVSNKYQKKDLALDNHRYNMLKIICNKHEKLDVSRIEIDSPVLLHSIDTLRIIQSKNPNKQILFALGTDNLQDLRNWYKPDKILEEFKILVIERGLNSFDNIIENDNFLKLYKNSFVKLETPHIDLSSTLVRKKLRNNEDISEYVSKEILEYINQNKLYN